MAPPPLSLLSLGRNPDSRAKKLPVIGFSVVRAASRRRSFVRSIVAMEAVDQFHGAADHARFSALYPELRRLARRERYRVGRPVDNQTTSLVHEAWLKLNAREGWVDRGHFLCAAAQAMRHVLISAARARLRMKRNPVGGQTSFTDGVLADPAMPDETLVELGKAVDRLAGFDARLASVVECRYFAGYTDGETAEALDVNERTVRRDWLKAKAWLFRELTA